jgi:hypothetical protein
LYLKTLLSEEEALRPLIGLVPRITLHPNPHRFLFRSQASENNSSTGSRQSSQSDRARGVSGWASCPGAAHGRDAHATSLNRRSELARHTCPRGPYTQGRIGPDTRSPTANRCESAAIGIVCRLLGIVTYLRSHPWLFV